MKDLGNIGPAELTIVTILVNLIRFSSFIYFSYFPFEFAIKRKEACRKCDRPLYIFM